MSGIDDLLAGPVSQRQPESAGHHRQGLGDAVTTDYTLFFPAGLLVLMSIGTLGGMLAFGGAPGG